MITFLSIITRDCSQPPPQPCNTFPSQLLTSRPDTSASLWPRVIIQLNPFTVFIHVHFQTLLQAARSALVSVGFVHGTATLRDTQRERVTGLNVSHLSIILPAGPAPGERALYCGALSWSGSPAAPLRRPIRSAALPHITPRVLSH